MTDIDLRVLITATTALSVSMIFLCAVVIRTLVRLSTLEQRVVRLSERLLSMELDADNVISDKRT